jgi:RsiW-degrading membrane proteinase PrsW (M82 family)
LAQTRSCELCAQRKNVLAILDGITLSLLHSADRRTMDFEEVIGMFLIGTVIGGAALLIMYTGIL